MEDIKLTIGSKIVFPFQIFEMKIVQKNKKQLIILYVNMVKGYIKIKPLLCDFNFHNDEKIIYKKTKIYM